MNLDTEDKLGGGILIQNTKRRPNSSGNIERTNPIAFIHNTLIANNTTMGSGGGIRNQSGRLTIVDSTIDNNTADGFGGGLSVGTINSIPARTSILGSNVTNNTAQEFSGGIRSIFIELTVGESIASNIMATKDGGGISFVGQEGQLLDIRGTNISDNEAANGAGIAHQDGNFDVLNSTLSANVASESGGGIALRGTEQVTSIANATISGNNATHDGGGIWQEAGSVTLTNGTIVLNDAGVIGGFALSDGEKARMVNTIVAGNTTSQSNHSDIEFLAGQPSINIFRTYHNLIGDPNTAGGLIGSPTQSFKGENVNLDANFSIIGNLDENNNAVPWNIEQLIFTTLADNLGGSTPVHALKVGSIAIDSGSPVVPSRRDGIPIDSQNSVIFLRRSWMTMAIQLWMLKATH